jgi:hypothetical protein
MLPEPLVGLIDLIKWVGEIFLHYAVPATKQELIIIMMVAVGLMTAWYLLVR